MLSLLKNINVRLLIGDGWPLPVLPEIVDALTSVQVTVSARQRSGFQLQFALGKSSRKLQILLAAGYFNPPRRVIIIVVLRGQVTTLMDGVITKYDVAPSNEPGQSTLSITGEDISRMLELSDLTGLIPYHAMANEARVALMLAKYAMYQIVPIIIPSILMYVPNPINRIPTQRGTDLQYITQLAEEVGYTFYIEPGPRPRMNIAYWGPEIRVGLPQTALLVNSDAHNNVDSLSFSFDGFSKTLFVIWIQEQKSKLAIPIPVPDVNPVSPPLGPKMPMPLKMQPITGLAKYTPTQAGLISLAKTAKSADVISGSGSLDVLRYGKLLRARSLVEVRGAGLPFDGQHFVKSVTYSMKPGEFKQNFTLARNGFFPFLPKSVNKHLQVTVPKPMDILEKVASKSVDTVKEVFS